MIESEARDVHPEKPDILAGRLTPTDQKYLAEEVKTMSERKAIYYGQVELIPGVICGGHILDDGTAVMSERGTADLLGMYHKALQSVATNWPPKSLQPFVDNGLSVATKLVEVTASKSPHKGRKIVVYSSEVIESLIRSYALAFAHDALRPNQRHVGKICVILQSSLVRTALEAAIKEACGFIPEIQKTAQKHYIAAIELIQGFGFTCSIDNHIATKKDIIAFLKVPESTLNSRPAPPARSAHPHVRRTNVGL